MWRTIRLLHLTLSHIPSQQPPFHTHTQTHTIFTPERECTVGQRNDCTKVQLAEPIGLLCLLIEVWAYLQSIYRSSDDSKKAVSLRRTPWSGWQFMGAVSLATPYMICRHLERSEGFLPEVVSAYLNLERSLGDAVLCQQLPEIWDCSWAL